MLPLRLAHDGKSPLRILCLGAHGDDIEIGCGATVLKLLGGRADVHVDWNVFSAAGARAQEARKSAQRFLRGAASREIGLHEFRDGFFPYDGAALKNTFETLKAKTKPDIIFTHCRSDRHQDHRLINELTWNTWRDHTILEYEIAKYDGDLGQPGLFVPIPAAIARRKVRILMDVFASQHGRHWFDEDVLWALLRLRGLEARSPTQYAEAFHAPKLSLL